MRATLLAVLSVMAVSACESDGSKQPKPSSQRSAAGSAADAHCVAVRSEYNRLKALYDLTFEPGDPLRAVADRDLAELMNHNWSCFR